MNLRKIDCSANVAVYCCRSVVQRCGWCLSVNVAVPVVLQRSVELEMSHPITARVVEEGVNEFECVGAAVAELCCKAVWIV